MIPKRKALAVLVALCFPALTNLGAMTWHWSNPQPHGNDVFDMSWHNGLTVEVGDSGQLYTSDDLNLWLARNTYTTNELLGVTYLGNRLVSVGELGSVVYSDDGVNFTCTNLPTANGDWLVSVASSSNLLVAVGDEAIIWTSPDGANWKYQGTAPSNGGHWLRGVTYGGGLFVAVGEGGYIATSANGTNWTRQAAPIGFTDDINWVSYFNTPASTNGFNTPGFIAVSDPGNAISSANGTSWARLVNAPGTNSLYGVNGDNDSRLLVGDNMLYLEDAANTFTNQIKLLPTETTLAPAWTYYSSVMESNGYVVAGEAGLAAQGLPATNAPYNWSALDNSTRSWMWQVTTTADFYVAVGSDATIMTSGDGANWSIEAVSYTNSVSRTNTVFFGVGGSANLLIAVGNAGTIVLSTNSFVTVTNQTNGFVYTNSSTLGVIWTPIIAPTTNDLHGVAYFGGQYFVSGGNGTILESANGQTWSAQTTPTTHYLSSLEVCSNGMVAVGDAGTILTSPDGVTWTARTSNTTNWIYRVRNIGGRLIAVGENGTIMTSANSGTNWTTRTSGTTSWLNDVCLVTNNYYIVGNQGTVLTSTNTTNWAMVPSISYNSLYGAATQNGQLVAVGIEGTILRSQIVPLTSPVQIISYSQADGQNLFLVAGTTNQFGIAIDQYFTLDSSTNLTNWITGPLLQTDSTGSLLFFTSLGTNPPPYTFYRARLVIQ